MRGWLAFLTSLAALSACKDPDAKVFKSSGNAETKPTPTMVQTLQGLNGAAATADQVTEAATVTYAIAITSNSGAKLCDGEVQLSIMSDFGLKFPNAKIQCLSLTVDLGGLLAAGAGLGVAGKDQNQNLSDDGKVLSIKNLANAQFNPPRPLILGPIIQDSSIYQNFTRSVVTDLTARDPQSGAQMTGHGQFDIQVLDVDTTYENKFVGKAFDKVLHWQMTTTGFDGIPAKYGLIFSRWEWLWNVRPIMIPKIVIAGKLSDFISNNGTASGGANDLVGVLTVELVVKAYNFSK